MDRVALIVDDERELREAAVSLLESHGLRVLQASNGHEAIALLEKMQPDVIVLDLAMPVADGWTVWDWAQQHPQRAAPIVVWTSSGLQTGAVGHAPIVPKDDSALLVKTVLALVS